MALDIGDQMPDVQLSDHQGTMWRSTDHVGRPLLLVFHRHLG